MVTINETPKCSHIEIKYIIYTNNMLSLLTCVDISSYFGDKNIYIVLFLVLGRHTILYQYMNN